MNRPREYLDSAGFRESEHPRTAGAEGPHPNPLPQGEGTKHPFHG